MEQMLIKYSNRMADKIATREAYGKALVALADKYPFVVLDADLAAATKTGVFKKAFPDRFFDCGIAENDMINVACGLALSGFIPFASSFVMFAAGRSFEQVRKFGKKDVQFGCGLLFPGLVREQFANQVIVAGFDLLKQLRIRWIGHFSLFADIQKGVRNP